MHSTALKLMLGARLPGREELTMFPIKHVVIIVKENHTFDNCFSALSWVSLANSCPTRGLVIRARAAA